MSENEIIEELLDLIHLLFKGLHHLNDEKRERFNVIEGNLKSLGVNLITKLIKRNDERINREVL